MQSPQLKTHLMVHFRPHGVWNVIFPSLRQRVAMILWHWLTNGNANVFWVRFFLLAEMSPAYRVLVLNPGLCLPFVLSVKSITALSGCSWVGCMDSTWSKQLGFRWAELATRKTRSFTPSSPVPLCCLCGVFSFLVSNPSISHVSSSTCPLVGEGNGVNLQIPVSGSAAVGFRG